MISRARGNKALFTVLILLSLLTALTFSSATPAKAASYNCHLSSSGGWFWSACTYSDTTITHWVHIYCLDDQYNYNPSFAYIRYDQGATHPPGGSTTYSSGVGCYVNDLVSNYPGQEAHYHVA